MSTLMTDELTLGEIALIEKLSGQPITALDDATAPKGAALAALVMVAKRRDDPRFTWNAAQAFTLSEAYEILGIDPDADEVSDDDAIAEAFADDGDALAA